MPIKTANTKLLHNKWQRFLLVTNVIRFNHRSDIPIATCDKRHFWQEIAICRHCYAWHVMSGFRTFNLMILGTWPLYAILLRYSDNQKSLGLRSCDLYGHAMRNTRLMIRLCHKRLRTWSVAWRTILNEDATTDTSSSMQLLNHEVRKDFI